MIRDSSDRQRLHPILAGNSTQIGPEAFLKVWCDLLAAELGAEYVVN
jgi:hypothetical protein